LWDPPLTAGNYDIVEDVNCNGQYDQGIDAIDSLTLIGFSVIPEFSFATVMITIISITAVLMGFGKVKHFRKFALREEKKQKS
jgi:hypothetical protein